MELVIMVMLAGLLIFEACVLAHYLTIAIKEKIEEERRYDAEYEKYMRGLKALDHMQEVYGIEIFLKN